VNLKTLILFLSAILVSPLAVASDYVLVPDMSQLQYQIFQNRVNIRNMNQFGTSWQGCCDKYYIDLTTEEGKAIWATMLAKMMSSQSLYIGVVNKDEPQARITFVGNW